MSDSEALDQLDARRDRVGRPRQKPPERRPARGTTIEPAVATPPPSLGSPTATAKPGVQVSHLAEVAAPPSARAAVATPAKPTMMFSARVDLDLEDVASRCLGELQAAGHRSSKRELVELLLWELRGRKTRELAESLQRFRRERAG